VRLGHPAFLGLFQLCDFLLAKFERAAWKQMSPASRSEDWSETRQLPDIADIEKTASEGVAKAIEGHVLIHVGLGRLTLVRAELYRRLLSSASAPTPRPAEHFLDKAQEMDGVIDNLRRGGVGYMVVLGLLTRAWLRFLAGARTGPESAQSDLDEAWEIAERGPMKLFMADIHLYRARLFGSRRSEVGSGNEARQYPWESPQANLEAAEKLINDCGYHRRDEELADAKAAILSR
jgi:hypothetical protein